jgi:hypothetical protein
MAGRDARPTGLRALSDSQVPKLRNFSEHCGGLATVGVEKTLHPGKFADAKRYTTMPMGHIKAHFSNESGPISP